MGFWDDLKVGWNDFKEFVDFAVDHPGDAAEEMSCKFGELGGILKDSGQQLGEIAYDAAMDLTPMFRSTFQIMTTDKVTPLRGCVLSCHLGLLVDHSGVYIGDDRIVHMDGDKGIEVVSPCEFVGRLNGVNPAFAIWCACRNGRPVGGEKIAKRAELAMGESYWRDYSLLTRNCHMLTQYCVSGKRDNGIFDFKFSNLEDVIRDKMDVNSWRVADIF